MLSTNKLANGTWHEEVSVKSTEHEHWYIVNFSAPVYGILTVSFIDLNKIEPSFTETLIWK